ncbi:MAG TPA: hypothetical protein VGJ95_04570 [Pseudonocardiaceae bacterium]
MPQTSTQPTFLPLTTSAAQSAAHSHNEPTVRAAAEEVWRSATEADAAAADCWTALLANCDSPGRRLLPGKLRALTEATASYAGGSWWHAEGSHLRRRLAEAEHELVEAVRDGDGEDFAEAFVGYDQAMATTVVAVQSRLGSPA